MGEDWLNVRYFSFCLPCCTEGIGNGYNPHSLGFVSQEHQLVPAKEMVTRWNKVTEQGKWRGGKGGKVRPVVSDRLHGLRELSGARAEICGTCWLLCHLFVLLITA